MHETIGGIKNNNIVHDSIGTVNHDSSVLETNGIVAFGIKVEGSSVEVMLPQHYPLGQDIHNKIKVIIPLSFPI